jgi:enoyl-CoA hydratase/carnithine racemase
MSTGTIKTSTAAGVATLEIARPQKKNAITHAMYEAMTDALARAQSDAQVRAVMIVGQPDAFTAGNDLEDFMQRPPKDHQAPVYRFMRELAGCDKPVVAAVTGLAVGIGTTLLLHCDLVYLSADAQLSMPFVRLGLVPEFASSLLLPKVMGHARAAAKLLLGEPMTAAEAAACGIATAVLPAGEVVAYAHRMAERFNTLPPEAVRAAKRLMRDPWRDGVDRALRAEADIFLERLASAEAQEAFAAFFAKRKPDFSKF